MVDGAPVATIFAGQGYLAPPDPTEVATRALALATTHHIDVRALREAADTVPVLDLDKQRRLPGWLDHMARTFAELGRERAALLGRLRTIAAMSSID